MFTNLQIYDALYTLAARGECEDALYGTTQPLAREAFARSLAGNDFPLVWFELPLLGMPRFDLHVALARTSLVPGTTFAPGAGSGYDQLLAWYCEEEPGGGGLAFAFDVGDGRIEDPAVHVNINNAPLSSMERFFGQTAGIEAAALYRDFTSRLPEAWSVWYTGVHPGRPGSPVRVDCFVNTERRNAYAADIAILESDLRSCGFSASLASLADVAEPILSSPFGLELQFDVLRDGSLGSTIGLSACFSLMAEGTARAMLAEGGAMFTLLKKAEALGMADSRWQKLTDGLFTRMVRIGEHTMALYGSPTFAKLRIRDGAPLDVKIYLEASAKRIA